MTMLERVARALWEHHNSRSPVVNDMSWEIIREESLFWFDYARAAIEALMEPTLEMLDCGHQAAIKTNRGGASGMTVEAQLKAECAKEYAAYCAMLKTALEES